MVHHSHIFNIFVTCYIRFRFVIFAIKEFDAKNIFEFLYSFYKPPLHSSPSISLVKHHNRPSFGNDCNESVKDCNESVKDCNDLNMFTETFIQNNKRQFEKHFERLDELIK